MTDIYKQHEAAFAQVQAFVILKEIAYGGPAHPNKQLERVATIAFKFPRDGAGRLYCYLHVIGLPMVRGHANGYGYDKKSAAFANAANKIIIPSDTAPVDVKSYMEVTSRLHSAAIESDAGNWDRALRESGFTVLQAV